MRDDQIALELYTVRRLMADDLPGTLQAVADMGYRAVELAGTPEVATKELAGLLRRLHLRPIAAHVGLAELRAGVEDVADRMAALHCPRVIVPALPEADRSSVAEIRRVVIEMAGYAKQLADRDIRLGYHNHAFEFEPLNGSSAWDILLAELPAEVELEIDVYWVAFADRDPVTEIRAAKDRVRLLHVKDRREDPEPHDAPAGEGILDFRKIITAGRKAGVEWYIVEQDEPADPLANVETSLRYLKSLARV